MTVPSARVRDLKEPAVGSVVYHPSAAREAVESMLTVLASTALPSVGAIVSPRREL